MSRFDELVDKTLETINVAAAPEYMTREEAARFYDEIATACQASATGVREDAQAARDEDEWRYYEWVPCDLCGMSHRTEREVPLPPKTDADRAFDAKIDRIMAEKYPLPEGVPGYERERKLVAEPE